MYTLYTVPGSCSTGIHILLNVLKLKFETIPKENVENFNAINPLGVVPVLDDGDNLIKEGAAVALYLLEKHNNTMLPADPQEKSVFLQKLIFNYATMQPAYNRLFFAMNNFQGATQIEAYTAAAKALSTLWKVIDDQLGSTRFVSGDNVTIIDYLLCIYANWGTFFDININYGKNVERMIKEVSQRPEFINTLKSEGVEYKLFQS